MEQNNVKLFHCTGDIDQRKPFNFGCNNIDNQNDYQLFCLNQMFPHQITLRINKRLHTDEDKQRLARIKRGLFDMGKPVNVFKENNIKIVTKMSQVKITENICLFNFRCDQVNKHIAKNVVKKLGFHEGMNIVCKSHYKTTKIRLYVNYRYVIKSIEDNKVIINEPVDDIDIHITHEILNKHFKLPYANTCDSMQGLSIDDKITIFDCNTPYVDRFFIWTALTRATDLNNVQIFEHSVKELMSLKKSWVRLYFNQKVQGYKHQDKKAGRQYNNEDYIDPEWFKIQYRDHKNCPSCNKLFEVSILEDNKVTSNITADRIDNKQPHTISNCQLMCTKCNVTKR